MKIIVVCTSSYVYGAEVATLNLLDGLKNEGHDILAVTTSWTDGEFSKRLKKLGIAEMVLPFGTFSKKLTWQAMSWSFNMLIRLPKLWFGWSRMFRKFNPDILLVTNPKHGLYLYPWLNKVPSLIVEHSEKPVSSENRWLYRQLTKRLSGFVVVSNYLVNNILQLGIAREKIHVIHNGVFSEKKKEHIAQVLLRKKNQAGDPVRIGIVGQISPHKGHDCLLQASVLLKQRERNFEVCVFGTGSDQYVNDLKNKLDDAGIAPTWKWPGYQSSLDNIFPAIDICVVPSDCDEAFGMTAVEAGAYRLPVVASARGALPEIIIDGKTGFLFESMDASIFASLLEKLIGDDDLRSLVGAAGQVHVFNEFTTEKVAANFNALFASLKS